MFPIKFHSGPLAEASVDLPDLHPVNKPHEWEWLINRTPSTPLEIGGYPAAVTEFDASCAYPDDPDDPFFSDICTFDLAPGEFNNLALSDDAHVMHIVVHHPTGPVVILQQGPHEGSYWDQYFMPFLNSIKFLDP